MAAEVLAQIQQVFTARQQLGHGRDPAIDLVEVVLKAKEQQIVLHGVGREGLMMRALAMRLYHLGLKAHCLGDMSCPPVGSGDLLLASAGPGSFSSVDALIATAKKAGMCSLSVLNFQGLFFNFMWLCWLLSLIYLAGSDEDHGLFDST